MFQDLALALVNLRRQREVAARPALGVVQLLDRLVKVPRQGEKPLNRMLDFTQAARLKLSGNA
ncbi:hypothetical protein J3A69_000683 [Pseudomonas putida]|nr:hypothetical protein [Pseudomonas sp. PvP089]MBP2086763.1 hypothetical protein [Pseudomonas sp. PvP088]MBP2221075.1 hypothetical protein [Pseudomonas putida]MBP2081620.1 hypothetical protein [Pseudomonas sp. PvP089]MBP2086764.1 hypothetical protein [Pseudomonas sp. PvP088]